VSSCVFLRSYVLITMASPVAKNRRSILVAIFPICLARFNRRSACTAPLPPSLAERSVRPLCFAPLAAVHTKAGRPTQRHYQHGVLWSVPPVHRVVGNTVNTRGERRHNRRADDRLVYSPYNGDAHSPGKRPLCSLCRRWRHASCYCCSYYAQLVLYCGVVGLVNITSTRNPKLS